MKNDNPRGSTNLHRSLARAVRLLEYLKKNTDKNNPITQTDLLRAGDDNGNHIFGAKKTLVKTIAALVDALNTDKDGRLKPKEDWRLSYKGFDRYYDCDGNNDDKTLSDVTDIYFNHIFSEAELSAIINALNTSKAINETQAKTIIGKLVKNLAKEEYKKIYKEHMYKLDFSEPFDSQPGEEPELLSENISKIQKAISDSMQISFNYNRIYCDPRGYSKKYKDSRGKLKMYGKPVRYISPYYIVCENGRLFLYGGSKNGIIRIFRVDMMKKIHLSGKGNSKHPSLDKLKVVGIPNEMTQEAKVRHLYSSYEVRRETVQFEWSCRDEKTNELICTALYSTFGNDFEIDENGLVTVNASLFGMKIFALQYADNVKVISPDDLVEDIQQSVRELQDKYL